MNEPRRRGARRLGLALLVAALGTAGAAHAQDQDPKISFERYTLPNGIEIILHQDNSVPIVAVDIWYHVGSGDEMPGKSGFAHLFEHMLFQGSKHVGEDKHFEILKNIGATTVNGTTNTDRTNYFEVVPSNQLETALWLESDRMGYLNLDEKEFANQQEVVRNERRQNYDNVPYGKSRAALYEALYPEGHPYRYMTIGLHTDLENATLDDVKKFYETWYVPANATVVIAGDFDTANCKKLVQKWFGDFPKSTRPAHRTVPMPVIPASKQTIKDPFAKLRLLQFAWNTPAFFAPGDSELDILAGTLTSKTGRLYKRLVLEEQLAVGVFGGQASQQLSSYFTIAVQLRSDADVDKVRKIVDEELAKVRSQPITEREFNRVVTNTESRFVWGLEPLLSRAQTLERYNHYVGNPDFITGDLDRERKSSPAKVLEIAKKYLGPEHRVEILTVPGAAGDQVSSK